MTKISAGTVQSYSDLQKTRDAKKLEKIGQDFEAYFMTSMLKDMDKAVRITKKSYREETTMAIMYEKLGDYLAKKGVGVKEMVLKYMARAEDTKVLSETGDNKSK